MCSYLFESIVLDYVPILEIENNIVGSEHNITAFQIVHSFTEWCRVFDFPKSCGRNNVIYSLSFH